MTEQPKLDEIAVPEEMEELLSELPELQKEPARQSLRFGVFLFGVVAVVAINLGAEHVPVLAQIPTEGVVAAGWQVVALALGFIGARTLRNTKG